MPKKITTLSTAELIAEITRRQQRQLPRLRKQAASLEKQLAAINAQIAELGGSIVTGSKASKSGPKPAAKSTGKGGKRPRNKVSLTEAVLAVLSKDKPMNAKQIISAVKANGYKTTSANFDTIVYQALAQARKKVKKVARGQYILN